MILVGHTAFTLAMFGLMWAVQIVIYPAFRDVAPDDFTAYAERHSQRIVAALAPLAPLEIAFSAWLFLDTPAEVSRVGVFISGVLLAAGWIATAAWYAPLHGRLQQGYDRARIDQLVITNWLRTGLWTARGVLACWFLSQGLS